MIKTTSVTLVTIAVILAQLIGFSGLIFVSMVLQASSVLNISVGDATASISKIATYGITPFHAMSFVAGFLLLLNYYREREFYISKVIFTPLKFLLLYAITAIIGAFVLPTWFSGIPVNLLIDINGAEKAPQPLILTASNLVQAFSLTILLIVLFYLLQISHHPLAKKKIIYGFSGAWILSLAIGIYEQAALHFNLMSLSDFLANNPGYFQAQPTVIYYSFARIGLPFTEPSYASAYMASITIGLFSIFFFGRNWWRIWPFAITALIGLLNTMGSTGLAATAIAFISMALYLFIKSLNYHTSFSIRSRAASLLLITLIFSTWGITEYKSSNIKYFTDNAIHNLIISKAIKTDGAREKSNKRALEIVIETKGLGVGLGSNRASSYFASMLSNTGIMGFFFFMGMLVTLLWRYWKAHALTDMQIFVAGALPTATLAMGLGIPDLNMPMYWGFIFLGFIFCPDETQMSGPAKPINDVAADKSPLESRS